MRVFFMILFFILIHDNSNQAQGNTLPQTCLVAPIGNTQIDCHIIRVPENPSQPEGQMIDISVNRFYHNSPKTDQAPLIYLHGGPGGQIIPYSDLYAYALAPLWQGRDFIVFDQRGVGTSRPRLDCPAYNDTLVTLLADAYSDDEWLKAMSASLEICKADYATQAIDLTQYTTRNSANDVIAILETLGYEQAHLLGISYGTRLALTVAGQAPERVASLILDSVVAPDVDGEAEFASNFYQAISAFFHMCAEDETCQQQYPDLEARFYRIIADYNATPQYDEFFDIYRGERRIIHITGDLFLEIMFNLLYDSRQYAQIPAQIERLERGNHDYFIGRFLQDLESVRTDISIGMYYAVMCQDEINFTNHADADALNQHLPESILSFAGDTNERTTLCAGYADGQSTGANNPIQSDVPAIIFNGLYDPITPPHWAQIVAENLSNSQLFIASTSGHAVFFSDDCALQIASQFINTPTTKLDTTCLIPDYDFFP